MLPNPLRRAANVAAFVARPDRSYVAGESFAVLWPSLGLSSFSMWGSPTADAMRLAVRALSVDRSRTTPYVSFADAGSLEGASEDAFRVLFEGMLEQTPIVAPFVLKQAVVRPRGLLGGVSTGFWAMVQPPFPIAFFDEPREAWEWLGLARTAGQEQVDEVIALSRRAPPWLAHLRAALASGDVSDLPGSARVTGLSPRTLQRQLLEAGTSFREEVARARALRARRLLAAPRATITSVARALQCTPQTLRDILRRADGTADGDTGGDTGGATGGAP